MEFGINDLKIFFKNPITIWLARLIKARIVIYKNRTKFLKIGYLSKLENVKIGIYNTIYDEVIINNSELDDYVYIASNSNISNCKIGKFCSIGPNVKVGFAIHPINFLSTFPAFFSTKKQCQITFSDLDYFEEHSSNSIGNDVWIGANSVILGNIKIGDGAIIAAGSVVTKDVLPYSIVGGVPAKIIKMRFNENKIDELLKLKWWEKDNEWIKKNISFFQRNLM
jgi:acetyltransferase-like isoleucine patch superfamily enzyme